MQPTYIVSLKMIVTKCLKSIIFFPDNYYLIHIELFILKRMINNHKLLDFLRFTIIPQNGRQQ